MVRTSLIRLCARLRFWVDPKEELAAAFMSQAPSPARAYYRRMVKNLMYQAIND